MYFSNMPTVLFKVSLPNKYLFFSYFLRYSINCFMLFV
nr:MAG TPA: hypothetical protein [Caudoviricetes sp.]